MTLKNFILSVYFQWSLYFLYSLVQLNAEIRFWCFSIHKINLNIFLINTLTYGCLQRYAPYFNWSKPFLFQLQHMSDSNHPQTSSLSMGPLDKSKALQEQDLLQDMLSGPRRSPMQQQPFQMFEEKHPIFKVPSGELYWAIDFLSILIRLTICPGLPRTVLFF